MVLNISKGWASWRKEQRVKAVCNSEDKLYNKKRTELKTREEVVRRQRKRMAEDRRREREEQR
ncbi:hypothetical protein SARC_08230 [Sphaeroforma arctica JP610]|uniref:Uncharacterized protein n=1 Tax=Sphaeroforma arctica JP610 TaxID=667725 RepID=A0A0L0FRZ5_9EUKA|nr:hypothetical protein SARC_08230 [Sphaeroforma arctica JP610]KNC79366.1 hypothetical protein SARC_08230 [Sphaeroforma arctica JP610]|eukprot:XP_014153268.1 hypothetical protein SARC_08230 [Sphaeroforma arctica JP610]